MGTLEDLIIENTKQMPGVIFKTNGLLSIYGRAIPDYAIPFFKILTEWIDELKSPQIVFDIKLEYINTSASMQLFALLRQLEDKPEISSLVVNWHYEEDDEDHYDTGQFFEEKLERTKFFYQVHAA
jgi:hypothetical protein